MMLTFWCEMTFKTTRGTPALHDKEWIELVTRNGIVFAKNDRVYSVDEFIERNVNGERRGYSLLEDDL